MASSDKVKEERAVLIGLSSPVLGYDSATEDTMDELEELLKTAGGMCEGRVLQNRASPDPKTFIGEGKVEEIKEFITANGLDLALFDNALSPSQTRALEKALDCRVIDRSAVILDIFADRARTSEGKLQVELAQYQYLLPRLSGMWGHLVRQTASGGKSPIGKRGQRETQLETDRRHIREKIARLKADLENVKNVRATQRRKRNKSKIPVAAIVGYTNAGKSTLLNTLTDSDIEANDRLFDTLDPTTRLTELANGQKILVSDTVGFIRKLPHYLINAFKATLEELAYADIILHVIDGSSPQWEAQAEVTEKLIAELCPPDIPRIRVFNKMDLCGITDALTGKDVVWTSAKTGEGCDKLMGLIEKALFSDTREVTVCLPYDRGTLLDGIYKNTSVKEINYIDNGIEILTVCDAVSYGKYKEYITDCAEDEDE